MRVVVLAGGFGGARMAHGFAQLSTEVELTVIVNTADDLQLHGLHVSPDLDTVMYTLAGLANPDTGWGVRDETWSAAEMLERYGLPTWFALGDRDLATHVARTAWLAAGEPLSTATQRLATALGVTAQLLPMSDDPVRTKVRTQSGWLDFQDYFVRRRHAEEALELRFDGIDEAPPLPAALAALAGAELIVLAPSNPFVSIAPILGVPGMLAAVRAAPAKVMAVSPIAGGTAFRGPAAKMLRSLAAETGSGGLARFYGGLYPQLIDVFVLDSVDAAEAPSVEAAGMTARVERTVLATDEDRRALARRLLEGD